MILGAVAAATCIHVGYVGALVYGPSLGKSEVATAREAMAKGDPLPEGWEEQAADGQIIGVHPASAGLLWTERQIAAMELAASPIDENGYVHVTLGDEPGASVLQTLGNLVPRLGAALDRLPGDTRARISVEPRVSVQVEYRGQTVELRGYPQTFGQERERPTIQLSAGDLNARPDPAAAIAPLNGWVITPVGWGADADAALACAVASDVMGRRTLALLTRLASARAQLAGSPAVEHLSRYFSETELVGQTLDRVSSKYRKSLARELAAKLGPEVPTGAVTIVGVSTRLSFGLDYAYPDGRISGVSLELLIPG